MSYWSQLVDWILPPEGKKPSKEKEVPKAKKKKGLWQGPEKIVVVRAVYTDGDQMDFRVNWFDGAISAYHTAARARVDRLVSKLYEMPGKRLLFDKDLRDNSTIQGSFSSQLRWLVPMDGCNGAEGSENGVSNPYYKNFSEWQTRNLLDDD